MPSINKFIYYAAGFIVIIGILFFLIKKKFFHNSADLAIESEMLEGLQKKGDDINVNIPHEGQSLQEFLGKLEAKQTGTAREKTQRLIEFLPL